MLLLNGINNDSLLLSFVQVKINSLISSNFLPSHVIITLSKGKLLHVTLKINYLLSLFLTVKMNSSIPFFSSNENQLLHVIILQARLKTFMSPFTRVKVNTFIATALKVSIYSFVQLFLQAKMNFPIASYLSVKVYSLMSLLFLMRIDSLIS